MNRIFLTFFIIALLLLLVGRLRVYFRTGLIGELIVTIGGGIVIFGMIFDNNWMAIGGFVIGNIGLIILLTVESAKRKEIFRDTNLLERIVGNVPLIKEKQSGQAVVRKAIGIPTGIICLILAFILYEKLTKYNLYENTVYEKSLLQFFLIYISY